MILFANNGAIRKYCLDFPVCQNASVWDQSYAVTYNWNVHDLLVIPMQLSHHCDWYKISFSLTLPLIILPFPFVEETVWNRSYPRWCQFGSIHSRFIYLLNIFLTKIFNITWFFIRDEIKIWKFSAAMFSSFCWRLGQSHLWNLRYYRKSWVPPFEKY